MFNCFAHYTKLLIGLPGASHGPTLHSNQLFILFKISFHSPHEPSKTLHAYRAKSNFLGFLELSGNCYMCLSINLYLIISGLALSQTCLFYLLSVTLHSVHNA